jgi:hypothetical protein
MLKIAVTAVAFACAGSAIGTADDLAKRPPTDQLGYATNAHGGSTAAPAPGSPGTVSPDDSAPPALGPPAAAPGAAPTAAPADAGGNATGR